MIDRCLCLYIKINICQFSSAEAEKVASVSKIQFEQKIMEKESLKKMSEIEGSYNTAPYPTC